jgi:hypothetical protein
LVGLLTVITGCAEVDYGALDRQVEDLLCEEDIRFCDAATFWLSAEDVVDSPDGRRYTVDFRLSRYPIECSGRVELIEVEPNVWRIVSVERPTKMLNGEELTVDFCRG